MNERELKSIKMLVSKIVEKIILARVPYREEIIPRAKHVTYFARDDIKRTDLIISKGI